MYSPYTYASTRAKVLEQKLLSETQLEMLLGAKSVKEAHTILQNTYIAPYLSKQDKMDVTSALDQNIVDVKRLIKTVMPNSETLDVLWIRYDYHNLKTIIKGKKAGLNNEDILKLCFSGGICPPDELLRRYEQNQLRGINPYFEKAKEQAEKASRVFEIDMAMNIFYFKNIKQIAKNSKSSFVRELTRLKTDLFNIETALRSHSLKLFDYKKVFVSGATFSLNDLKDKKLILNSLRKIGDEKMWRPAIEEYEKTGSYVLFEKTADDHVALFLKEKSWDIFSIAPVFSYFIAQKRNAQIIGAILTAKRSGMKEKELRTILRRIYT